MPRRGREDFIGAGVRVEGARELRRAIRQSESDLRSELKKANKEAAETVAQEAKSKTVPVRDGDLKNSISALGSQTKGQVKAGKASRNTKDYAGVIHYGDPSRGIRPQPFLHEAMGEKWDEVFSKYEKALEKIVDDLSA